MPLRVATRGSCDLVEGLLREICSILDGPTVGPFFDLLYDRVLDCLRLTSAYPQDVCAVY